MPGSLAQPTAKKAGRLRNVAMHRAFLQERRKGLTDRSTRTSKEIKEGTYKADTITSRRRKALGKSMY